jgi:hypothetical protein
MVDEDEEEAETAEEVEPQIAAPRFPCRVHRARQFLAG